MVLAFLCWRVLVAAVLPCAFAVSSRECVLMAMFGVRR
jgi:hypothetical protein